MDRCHRDRPGAGFLRRKNLNHGIVGTQTDGLAGRAISFGKAFHDNVARCAGCRVRFYSEEARRNRQNGGR